MTWGDWGGREDARVPCANVWRRELASIGVIDLCKIIDQLIKRHHTSQHWVIFRYFYTYLLLFNIPTAFFEAILPSLSEFDAQIPQCTHK